MTVDFFFTGYASQTSISSEQGAAGLLGECQGESVRQRQGWSGPAIACCLGDAHTVKIKNL